MRRSFYTKEFIHEHGEFIRNNETFEEDFELLRTVLAALHANNKDVSFMATKLSEYNGAFYSVYELKKVACRAIRGRGGYTGLHIIYLYNEKIRKITFCELYLKSEKESYNKERIEKIIGELLIKQDNI